VEDALAEDFGQLSLNALSTAKHTKLAPVEPLQNTLLAVVTNFFE
jgi:hypothetical protein